MSFIVRPVRHEDINQLTDLARQFVLLNLPGDRKVITKKIEKSLASFQGQLSKPESEYLFVLEDTEEKLVVGSSLIMAKHGTEEIPHNFFKILKRNHYSDDLGLGFIHQVLRFQMDTDGPSEIGGLLVDKIYRRRPEKLGKQISLSRFMYIALNMDRFEDSVSWPFDLSAVKTCMEGLKIGGSVASPGFMNPEGVVIYHVKGNLMFKATLEGDDEHKFQLSKS